MANTTIKQKIGLILTGIIFTLIFLEVGLRSAGFVLLYVSAPKENTISESYTNNTYRILALGESTTEMGGKNSWPSQLETVLNNKTNKFRFKVFNEGIAGTTTAFIVARLGNNLQKYNPNMVITMMGINDVPYIKYDDTFRAKVILFFTDLRIYKLGTWIIASLHEKFNMTNHNTNETPISENFSTPTEEDILKKIWDEGKCNDAENMFRNTMQLDSKNDYPYYFLGCCYRILGKYTIALNMTLKAIQINPLNYKTYSLLGDIYLAQGNVDLAKVYYEKSIKLNQNQTNAYNKLGYIYEIKGMSKKAKEMYLRTLWINPSDVVAAVALLDFNLTYQEMKTIYEKMNIPFRITLESIESITKYHYNKLYAILASHGIKYIAMQYPTLDVAELKDMFKGDEDIIFVSNENNFKEALKNGTYSDYFIDHIHENREASWGHATPLGNRLIAENVATVILEELNITK